MQSKSKRHVSRFNFLSVRVVIQLVLLLYVIFSRLVVVGGVWNITESVPVHCPFVAQHHLIKNRGFLHDWSFYMEFMTLARNL